jgi:succinate dehydrogenase hydrophobic anchor subunit
MMTLRVFHRTTAIIVVIFVVAHLSNHLAALTSVDAHRRLMDQLRLVYRQPVIEVLLLVCVSLQAATGLRLVWRNWRARSGVIEWVQAASGAYMALFLLIHVAAVLMGRAVYGLDTNFHYAAAGLHVSPFQYFFAPYYFFAVAALFAHLGCALSWYVGSRMRTRVLVVGVFICIGVAISTMICAALMGKIYPYEVPEQYKNTYRGIR